MNDDAAALNLEQLLDLVDQQGREIERLRAEVERLKAELEKARRAGKRQAAPFSRGEPKARPKRPGRPPGHAPSHRQAPTPEQVDRVIDVPLPEQCPACQAPLDDLAPEQVEVRDQYQLDLPEPRPVVTHFRIEVADCPACGAHVQGRHPEQTSDATGAAAVQLGPRLLATAAELKHRHGVPFRKVVAVIAMISGLTVCHAAIVRGCRRLAERARPSYEALVEAAGSALFQHVDETGWRIGGRSAWLWVFADDRATIYRIRPGRGHEVVLETLGRDFAGVMITDCYLAYDPLPYLKGKCLAHLLRRCSDLEEEKSGIAARFSLRVAALLRAAMALKRKWQDGEVDDAAYAAGRAELHARLDKLIDHPYTDADNERLAKLLRKHRESLLRFLDHAEVDATNNLAEREIRPAVVARKVSGGNRTESGAEVHAVLASVLRTLSRQGRDGPSALIELLRRGEGHVLEFDHITGSDGAASS